MITSINIRQLGGIDHPLDIVLGVRLEAKGSGGVLRRLLL